MNFSSRKDPFFFIPIYGLIIYLLFIAFEDVFSESQTFYNLLHASWVIIVSVFLITFLHVTHYQLTKERLFYRSGILSGKINVDDIREIVVGKTLWVGMRPATARKGLIVKYKKGFGEIYISPETNESFIEEILKYNSNIKISR